MPFFTLCICFVAVTPLPYRRNSVALSPKGQCSFDDIVTSGALLSYSWKYKQLIDNNLCKRVKFDVFGTTYQARWQIRDSQMPFNINNNDSLSFFTHLFYYSRCRQFITMNRCQHLARSYPMLLCRRGHTVPVRLCQVLLG